MAKKRKEEQEMAEKENVIETLGQTVKLTKTIKGNCNDLYLIAGTFFDMSVLALGCDCPI